METLLALGILAAYLLSAVQTLRGQTHVYFDTAAAIVTLVLAGKLIERAAKDRAARSVGMLYRLMPKKVRILTASGERFVSIDALQPGQVFVVKAGERIPADGIVVEGRPMPMNRCSAANPFPYPRMSMPWSFPEASMPGP